MLSIIVLEDDALLRHRVGRLLDEAVESRRPLLMGLPFMSRVRIC